MSFFETWKLYLGLAGGIILTALVSYGLHSWSMNSLQTKYENQLKAQYTQLVDQCNKDKAITKESEDELQAKIVNINAQHNAIVKRLRRDSQTCLLITNPSDKSNGTSKGKSVPKVVGLNAFTITSKLEACDENTEKLITLQSFVNKTWQSRSHN